MLVIQGVKIVSGVGHGVGHGGKAVGKGAFGLAYRATHGGHARSKSSASATADEEEFMAAGLKAGHTAQATVMDPTTGELKTPTKTAMAPRIGDFPGYATESTSTPTLEGRVNVTITGVQVEGAEKTLVVVKQNGRVLEKTRPTSNGENQFGETFIGSSNHLSADGHSLTELSHYSENNIGKCHSEFCCSVSLNNSYAV